MNHKAGVRTRARFGKRLNWKSYSVVSDNDFRAHTA